jgi:hypothetical protein
MIGRVGPQTTPSGARTLPDFEDRQVSYLSQVD